MENRLRVFQAALMLWTMTAPAPRQPRTPKNRGKVERWDQTLKNRILLIDIARAQDLNGTIAGAVDGAGIDRLPQ